MIFFLKCTLTQAVLFPVTWEEPGFHWLYSYLYPLLKTYSATTVPQTPACRSAKECLMVTTCSRKRGQSRLYQPSLTYDSSTASRGSGWESSWSWLAWSLLRRMMSHRVWDALDCLCHGTACTKRSVMGNVYWRHCEYYVYLSFPSIRKGWNSLFLFTSSSLSGWISSMSLWASFSSFSHCRGTVSNYNGSELLCIRF